MSNENKVAVEYSHLNGPETPAASHVRVRWWVEAVAWMRDSATCSKAASAP